MDVLEFDYVVVCAGPAGCVLAARLRKAPDATQYLLEGSKPDAR